MVRLMRRHAAAATLAGAAIAWGLWSGCNTSGSGRPGGTGGYQQGTPTKKPAVDAAPDAAAAADGATSDGPAQDGLPYPGAEACPGFPGWYRAPGLPKGCFSGCVPDDPALRIPALKWDARDDWCPGCKWLETPWWPDPQAQDRPAMSSVRGFGAEPDFFYFGMRQPGGGDIVALYSAQGRAVMGVRGGPAICGSAVLVAGQDNKTVGMNYRAAHLTDERWLLRPADRARELLTATQPDFAYTDAFVGNDSSEGSWLTADWIVDEFTGFLALADVKTGTASKVDTMPGALPGEYDRAVISGDAVFVMHFTNKSDWMIVQDGVIKPFIGGPDVDVDKFATDGKWIVWNEGSQLSYDPKNPDRLVSGRYDLYRSPFTTDPSKLQRQLLVSGTHQFYGYATLANGLFTARFFSTVGAGEALVVDVSTGRAWTSDLPQGYSWGEQNYPAPSELWGTIAPTGNDEYASAVVRVPYGDMTQIQTGLP